MQQCHPQHWDYSDGFSNTQSRWIHLNPPSFVLTYDIHYPEINVNCTNLWLNYNYCVAPYPPLSSSTIAPTMTSNYSSGVMNSSPLPTANYTISWYTQSLTAAGVAAPTNVANGTRELGQCDLLLLFRVCLVLIKFIISLVDSLWLLLRRRG